MSYVKGKSIYVLYVFLLLALFLPRPRLVFSQINIDTNAPYIVEVSPNDGQTNVPVNSSITVMFSEDMDDILTNNSFWINPFIAGDIFWELDQTLIFSPSMLLNYGENYNVSIDTKATSLSGQSIEEPYQWSFTTEASPWLHFYDIQGLSLDQNNVVAIMGDNTGDIWVALSSSGSSDDLFRFNGIDPTDFHKILESIGQINAFALDSSGGLWIASESPSLGGVHFYDGMDWTHYNTGNSIFSDNAIKCLAIDSEDNIWVGSSSSGIYRFDGESWTNYTMDNSFLSDNFVTAIGVDENDQIWVNTLFGGFESFDDPNVSATWTNHTSSIESQVGIDLPYINKIVSGSEKIWAGTNLGLLSYDIYTAEWELFTQIDEYLLDGGRITSLTWDSFNNTLYVGTYDGALMFDGVNWEALLLGDVGPEVFEIAVDVYGIKWIGTSNSLSRYDTDAPSLSSFTPNANSKDVSRTGKIVLNFDEPMNRNSVISAVNITPSFSYSSSWDIHSTKLIISPKSNLKSSTKYTVTLSKAATDLQGHSLSVGTSWSFTTAKSTTSTSSAYGVSYGSYSSFPSTYQYQSFNLSNTLSNLYKTGLTSRLSFGNLGLTQSFNFQTSKFSLSTNFGNTFSYTATALNRLQLGNTFNLTNNFGGSSFGSFNIRKPAIAFPGFQGISSSYSSYFKFPN